MGVWMCEGTNSYKNCAEIDMKHKGFSIMQICLFWKSVFHLYTLAIIDSFVCMCDICISQSTYPNLCIFFFFILVLFYFVFAILLFVSAKACDLGNCGDRFENSEYENLREKTKIHS